MAVCKQTTEPIFDKASEFAAFANPSIKNSFAIDTNAARLRPLTLTYFNGENAAFSDAFVSYRKQSACYRMETWNSFYYKKLVEVMAGKENIEESDRPPFQRLFDFLEGSHLPCLETLLQRDIKERKIAAIMTIHYFKPLLPNGTYIMDKSYQGATTKTHCELCKQDINYGDTSFGNMKVWHGKVDIILKRHIVKVSLEDDLSKLDVSDEEDEELSGEENEGKDFMKYSKNAKKQQMKSQFIAEGIVNAFFVSNQESNRNQFIPSFLVTERYIRILLYNVELDILLKSTKLPIWLNESEGSLDVMTLIRVWLTLNYTSELDRLRDRYDFFLKHIEKAGFKAMAGDAYSEYLHHIEQPLKSTRGQKKRRAQATKADFDFRRYDLEEELILLDFTSQIIK